MAVQSVKELTVYIKAYQQAMSFFEISKNFPPKQIFTHSAKKNLTPDP
jgi:hypothetical protein